MASGATVLINDVAAGRFTCKAQGREKCFDDLITVAPLRTTQQLQRTLPQFRVAVPAKKGNLRGGQLCRANRFAFDGRKQRCDALSPGEQNGQRLAAHARRKARPPRNKLRSHLRSGKASQSLDRCQLESLRLTRLQQRHERRFRFREISPGQELSCLGSCRLRLPFIAHRSRSLLKDLLQDTALVRLDQRTSRT